MIVDENIGDDIRVTVVATGLSKAQSQPQQAHRRAATINSPSCAFRCASSAAPVAPTRSYEEFDTPSVLKKQQASPAPAAPKPATEAR
jgi:cell division protein FtsZ